MTSQRGLGQQIWLALGVLLVGMISMPALGQTAPQPGAPQPEAAQPAAPQPEAAQPAAPEPAPPPPAPAEPAAAPKEAKPYDIWTTKKLLGDPGGLRSALEDVGIVFDPILGVAFAINTHGGANTHHAHDITGQMFHNITLDFDKMFGLKGGSFFFRGIQSWNNGIRPDVGSLSQPFYVIGHPTDKAIEIDKWWYRQRLFDDRLEFRLGKLLASDLIDRNEVADNFLSKFSNQAFFLNQSIPDAKSLGAFVRVWPVDWLYLQAAAVDPDNDKDHHRHGTSGFETAFHGSAHFRTYFEFGILPNKLPMDWAKRIYPGNYRFGLWYDPASKQVFIDDLGGLRAVQRQSGDVGWYFNFDQMVWKEKSSEPTDKQGLSIFARYGFAHPEVNRINHFWSTGAAYTGLIPSRDKDALGFAVAQSILSKTQRHNVNALADRETIYELYYAIVVTPWCVITPDLQVITNPGGNRNAHDSLVAGVRVRIAF